LTELLDIVIVNWNAGLQLAEAVTSIVQHHDNLVLSVIIVDNASSDDSIARVEALPSLPFQLQIIRNKQNRGFAAACNQGAALATGYYLLFLNPDTRLLENSLSVPQAFMKQSENADAGICGIQLQDESGHVARTCARFPSLGIFVAQVLGLNKVSWFRSWGTHMSEWDHGKAREVDHVIGAFYLTRRSLFELLGGFDERFFVYLEDLDFSLRAREAGWRTVYLAEAQAFHLGGGASHQVKARRLFYSLRSRLLYGFKHFTPWQEWALLGVTLSLEPVIRSMVSLLRGGIEDVQTTLKAYVMLYRDMPNILRKARQP
jgi:GT2 family glycosyltransferase